MLSRKTPRKPRNSSRWMRAMSFTAAAEIAEAISRLKAETWAALVDGRRLLEAEADALIEQALAGQAGYQGTERLEYARRQLAALRAELLPPADTAADDADHEPEPDPDAGRTLVCVPWQIARQAVR